MTTMAMTMTTMAITTTTMIMTMTTMVMTTTTMAMTMTAMAMTTTTMTMTTMTTMTITTTTQQPLRGWRHSGGTAPGERIKPTCHSHTRPSLLVYLGSPVSSQTHYFSRLAVHKILLPVIIRSFCCCVVRQTDRLTEEARFVFVNRSSSF